MKSSITSFIGVLVLGIAVFGIYWAWYAFVSSQSNVVADLQDQIATTIQSITNMTSAHAALAGIASDEEEINNYFVPEDNVVSFINYLENAGQIQKADVSVTSVSKGTAGSQSTLIFALSVDGTFDAIMHVIGALEYAPYDISISTLSIGHTTKNNWHADFNITVGSIPGQTATSTP